MLDSTAHASSELRREELSRRLARVEMERDRQARSVEALMAGAESILGAGSFEQSARAIFDYCCEMTGATSGYVALLSDDGQENEVLFLEAGGMPCSVDPSLPMPIRGLRAEAYESCKAVYHNDFMDSRWAKLMPDCHVHLRNVMFAPLVVDGQTVGIIGLANKDGDFTDHDARIAGGFGRLAALALKSSLAVEARDRAEAELRRLAVTDPLTGLYNRRAFFATAQNEVERSTRYGRPLSCLMLDLDGFKGMNDTYGHDFGDRVLEHFATRAGAILRTHDTLARLGGDEFGILLPETDAENAVLLARRLIEDLDHDGLEAGDTTVNLRISVGVATWHPDEKNLTTALKRADEAMYRAKERGGHGVEPAPCPEGGLQTD